MECLKARPRLVFDCNHKMSPARTRIVQLCIEMLNTGILECVLYFDQFNYMQHDIERLWRQIMTGGPVRGCSNFHVLAEVSWGACFFHEVLLWGYLVWRWEFQTVTFWGHNQQEISLLVVSQGCWHNGSAGGFG